MMGGGVVLGSVMLMVTLLFLAGDKGACFEIEIQWQKMRVF
jgi:hypothetical protein